MLRLVGSNYYFRRAVPLDLRPLLGRGEVSHSLKTSNKLEARQKAALFYARTGQCFQEIRRMTSGVPAKTLNAMDLVSFYEQFVKDLQNYHADHIEALTMRHKVETTEMLFREVDSIQSTKRFLDVVGRYLKETEDFLQGLHQQDALNQAVSRTRETMLREEITGLRKMVVEIKGTLPQERLPPPQADDAEMRLPTPTVSPPKKTAHSLIADYQHHGPALHPERHQ